MAITFSQLRAGYCKETLLGGDSSAYHLRVTDGNLSFVSPDKGEGCQWPGSSVLPHELAAYFGRTHLFELETTVALLPRNIKHSCGACRDILDLEEQFLRTTGDDRTHYLFYEFIIPLRSLSTADRGSVRKHSEYIPFLPSAVAFLLVIVE